MIRVETDRTHYRPTLVAKGSVWEVALDLRCADGRRLPVLLNAILTRDSAGDPLVIRTSVFDARRRRQYEFELLTARRRAEESEARARELALTLQASLLPPQLPRIDGLDLGAAYLPAGDGAEVGGDFYDVFEAAAGDWIIALGDVCGKGAPAAALTGLARYTIRASSMSDGQPSTALQAVNTVLLRDQADQFCTAVCMRVHHLDGGRVEVRLAVAGHPLPLPVGPEGVRAVGRGGKLLGVVPDADLEDVTIILHPGEGLLCYSDGLTEARQGRAFLGEEGVEALVRERLTQDAAEMAAGLADAVVRYQSGQQRDDMAVIYVRVPEDSERG